ncbi:uncharacterized protein LDX57_008687 [Aspergillus melleus]|uniref:uncharacterized protein n=1 Tax=Aspergillus melleus TaxID=138277 RepID=UPI001E8D6B38|nr:uncharacterized protein LDX57_008687 [Aspergillus melleus]KAH8431026.1 hypothetical protein LDX57_008687 [Aspergillus melleus]
MATTESDSDTESIFESEEYRAIHDLMRKNKKACPCLNFIFWRRWNKGPDFIPKHLDDQLEAPTVAHNLAYGSPEMIRYRLKKIIGSATSVTLNLDLLFDYQVEISHFFEGKRYDYPLPLYGILLYGDKKDLKTNLIITREDEKGMTESKGTEVCGTALLMYQAMRKVGLKREMYGIVTDSYKWHFTRISRNGQCYSKSFEWDIEDQRRSILRLLRKIVVEALQLAQEDDDPYGISTQGISEAAGCVIEIDHYASDADSIPSTDSQEN